uniref:Uncharacterized protein n=1 Tax=Plectus sambesii TaxID=2011161 RepID=A0A914WNJ6_9BILA
MNKTIVLLFALLFILDVAMARGSRGAHAGIGHGHHRRHRYAGLYGRGWPFGNRVNNGYDYYGNNGYYGYYKYPSYAAYDNQWQNNGWGNLLGLGRRR